MIQRFWIPVPTYVSVPSGTMIIEIEEDIFEIEFF